MRIQFDLTNINEKEFEAHILKCHEQLPAIKFFFVFLIDIRLLKNFMSCLNKSKSDDI